MSNWEREYENWRDEPHVGGCEDDGELDAEPAIAVDDIPGQLSELTYTLNGMIALARDNRVAREANWAAALERVLEKVENIRLNAEERSGTL